MAPSRLLTQIFRSLPQESQCAFVEDHLAPLLDTLPQHKANKIIRALKRTQARHHNVPELDLEQKKREMQVLVRVLEKDDKIAFCEERSHREEILEEVVHSLSSWMNKIWGVVYEHKANYLQAHKCLIYCLRSVLSLGDVPGVGDCKCLYNNMHVAVALRDNQKRTVKYFSFLGPQNLDRVVLWIWRDLFLTMLVEENHSQDFVKEMMLDIEELLGWQGLEKMLHGGKRISPSGDDEGCCSEEDEDDEDVLCRCEGEGTDDEFENNCNGDEICRCRLHAKYWSDVMSQKQKTLLRIVKNRLIDIFRTTPDLELFYSISMVSGTTSPYTLNQLFQILSDVAGNSADALKAALTIFSTYHQHRRIINLLETYHHYLLPIDFPILLHAVAVLAESPDRRQALKYVERELAESVENIHAAIRSTFCHLAAETNKQDLAEILKIPPSSPNRAVRIGWWVDHCLTSTSEPLNPMAFAAMMMFPVGPLPPPMDGTQFLALTDPDKPDPDLDDLREEFRPQLAFRFSAWYEFTRNVLMAKSCAQILRRIYAKVIELMPFFRAPDIAAEMMDRIADKQSKVHVHSAMADLLSFCATQRNKRTFHGVRRQRQREAGPNAATQAAQQPAAANSTVPQTPGPFVATANGPILVLPHPFPQGSGPP